MLLLFFYKKKKGCWRLFFYFFVCIKDEAGTIYYFNETTGESRWDKPKEEEKDNEEKDNEEKDNGEEDNEEEEEEIQAEDTYIRGLNPNELKKLVRFSKFYLNRFYSNFLM